VGPALSILLSSAGYTYAHQWGLVLVSPLASGLVAPGLVQAPSQAPLQIALPGPVGCVLLLRWLCGQLCGCGV